MLDLRGPESNSGRFSVDIGYQLVFQDQVLVGTRKGTVGEIPSHHNEVETRTETWVATGRAGVTDWLSLSASLPYIDRVHRHESEHHPGFFEEQKWTYSGLGDLTVLGYLTPGAGQGRPSVTLQLGLKAPTGKRNVGEIEGEQPEPMARPSSGSWDGLVGVQVRHWVDTRTFQGDGVSLPLSAGVLARVNGPGTDDYRAGNELQLNVAGGWALLSRVSLLAQVNTRWRAKDDVGATDGEEANTGGTAVFATPGLRVGFSPTMTAYGYVQMRLYERVNGIQITAPYHVMVGTSYGF
ncbi:MAG TPA: transporter [Candidatus Limnocylindria bacterium]|nr:transporter [Candidatus Limnocylindria bacterium]